MSRSRRITLLAAAAVAVGTSGLSLLLGAQTRTAPAPGPRMIADRGQPAGATGPATAPSVSPAGSPAVSPALPPDLPGPGPTATPAAGCPDPAPFPVTQAPGAGRTVALTFDDGPGDDTPAVLDVLREQHVHATFFVVGGRIGRLPALVTRTSAEGHLVGDHSWSHRYPGQVTGGWTARYLRAELLPTREAITQLTGRPVCWFRPPGGERSPAMLPTARGLGFSVALWSVDPKDWRLQGSRRTPARSPEDLATLIFDRAIAGLDQAHPVILLHDGGGYRGATVAALTRIIEGYRAHGYRFVRLDGLP